MALLASEYTVGESALLALLGYGVVFFGIILLMIVVIIMGKIFVAAERRKSAAAAAQAMPQPAPAPVEKAPEPAPVAPGAAGQLKLHDVEPKTAAMLMAIVADKMGKPLNELRFISIKEVK
ncbi:MAG: OadG family protein [Firmicutes bacterium]|nr:OadG family protein [Bacillota bacterium]